MVGFVRCAAALAVAAAVSGCGVVYKPQVIISGCISSSRALGGAIHDATVDGHNWGPGSAQIRFIDESVDPPKTMTAECRVANDGELASIKVDGKKPDEAQLEIARKAFRDIAQSPAWANQ